ncbi:MAG: FG-GAP-like repeat-containing protein, partial [Dokdonella sp.]
MNVSSDGARSPSFFGDENPAWSGCFRRVGTARLLSRHGLFRLAAAFVFGQALTFDVAHAQSSPDLVRSYTGCCGLGWAVADIADLDGDGRRDFVVSVINANQVVAYSTANGTPLWTSTPAGLAAFGSAISSAGDINGDGRSDVIAGAPLVPGGGAVRLISGLNGQILLAPPKPVGAVRYGSAVSALPDMNGDGVGELLVGAPGGNGAVYVQSGSDGSVLRTHTGTPASEFGAGVSSLADIDGDGIRDYVVGAPGDGPGRAYVYSGATGSLLFTLTSQSAGGHFGEFFVADAGDVDADGTTDIYVGAYDEAVHNGAAYVFSGRTGLRLFRIGGTSAEGMGPGRAAGDVDGDGHADIIVGSYTYSGAGIGQGGRVSIFSGADQSVLARVNGTRPGGQLGFDAVGVGDVTGDGRLDFIVASSPASAVDLFAGVLNSTPPSATLHFDSAAGPTMKTIVRSSGAAVKFAWTTSTLPAGATCRIYLRPNDAYAALASPTSSGTLTNTTMNNWAAGTYTFYLGCSNGTQSSNITLVIQPAMPTASLHFDSSSGPTTKTVVRNSGTPVTFAWTASALPSGATCRIYLRPNDAYAALASPTAGGTLTNTTMNNWGTGTYLFYLGCSNGTQSSNITLEIQTATPTAALQFDSSSGPTTKIVLRNSATPVTFAWNTSGLPSGATCRIFLRPNNTYAALASPTAGGILTNTTMNNWATGTYTFYLGCSNGTQSGNITLAIQTSTPTATFHFDSSSGPTTKTVVRNSGTPVTFAW